MKKVLSVMLALAMVFAMNITTFAATDMAAPVLGEVEKQDDGTYKLAITVNGSLDEFDYGLAYNSSEVTIKSVKWGTDFAAEYSDLSGTSAKYDFGVDTGKGTYVVFGGTVAKTDGSSYTFNGEVGYITFELKGDSAQFAVVKNSAKFADTYGEVLTATSAAKDSSAVNKNFEPSAPTPTPAPETPAPTTDTPGTQTPETQAPETQAPGTSENPNASAAPTVAPTTGATTTKAPTATSATTATTNTSKSAKTGDTANVVLPIVAICAAAAAVVVASKKKVEE